MTDVPDLAHLSEAGFEALYRERIAPLLEAADGERQALVRQFRTTLVIGALAAVGAGAGLAVLSGSRIAGLILAACGLVGAYALAYGPLRSFGGRVKGAVLSAVAEAVGVSYASAEFQPFDRFCALGLLPGHDLAHFEDHFAGTRAGCAFELSEAVLEVEDHDPTGGRSSVTVFRGQLMRLALPQALAGRTIVHHAGEAPGAEGLERVDVGDGAFCVYGDNPEAARRLARPQMLQRLAAMETAFKGRHLRCAFDGGDFLLAMDSPDRFEIGDVFAPLADPARARRVVGDIGEVLRVMDAALAAQQAIQSGA